MAEFSGKQQQMTFEWGVPTPVKQEQIRPAQDVTETQKPLFTTEEMPPRQPRKPPARLPVPTPAIAVGGRPGKFRT